MLKLLYEKGIIMKKLLLILLALSIVLLCLAGCNQNDEVVQADH